MVNGLINELHLFSHSVLTGNLSTLVVSGRCEISHSPSWPKKLARTDLYARQLWKLNSIYLYYIFTHYPVTAAHSSIRQRAPSLRHVDLCWLVSESLKKVGDVTIHLCETVIRRWMNSEPSWQSLHHLNTDERVILCSSMTSDRLRWISAELWTACNMKLYPHTLFLQCCRLTRFHCECQGMNNSWYLQIQPTVIKHVLLTLGELLNFPCHAMPTQCLQLADVC